MLMYCDLWPKEFKIEQWTGLLLAALQYTYHSFVHFPIVVILQAFKTKSQDPLELDSHIGLGNEQAVRDEKKGEHHFFFSSQVILPTFIQDLVDVGKPGTNGFHELDHHHLDGLNGFSEHFSKPGQLGRRDDPGT